MYRKILNFIKAQPRWRTAVVLVAVAGLAFWASRSSKSTADMATFTARRGPLQISVLEGGTMQAINSQEIKCEVRVGYQGQKILKIVDEGYQVSEEDVKAGKVLVELDSSELQKQAVQQEILFQTANAALADARQGYDIQVIQNTSDILAAEQKARFARMDFDKFLGSQVAEKIIADLGIDDIPATNSTDSAEPAGKPSPGTNSISVAVPTPKGQVLLASLDLPPSALMAATNGPNTNDSDIALSEAIRPSSVDFSIYTNMSLLGDGEAKQKLRKFDDDFQIAEKEIRQSLATLEGTRRLHAKGFVTRTDLQRDEIAYENTRLKVQTAATARDLFVKYEMLKSSEETLSKYCEAVRELERARKSAIAKLAQADAKLKSATAQFNVQSRQRKDLEQQIEKCTIKAEKPGLVIYGRAGDDMMFYGGSEERIREGASVRERQTILTIPDMSRMGVKVKIHETYIKKVKAGQKARLTVDAFPDKVMEGEVTKVGVLPDSGNRWMNPDMKVYLTTIAVNGTNDWLKPGMSTKVEVLVDRLEDAVYVPIQSVVPENGKFVCHVVKGSTAERREVEVGQFNDEFIEVTKGIAEGEEILLHPPRPITSNAEEREAKPTNAAPARGLERLVPRGRSNSVMQVPVPESGTNLTRKARAAVRTLSAENPLG